MIHDLCVRGNLLLVQECASSSPQQRTSPNKFHRLRMPTHHHQGFAHGHFRRHRRATPPVAGNRIADLRGGPGVGTPSLPVDGRTDLIKSVLRWLALRSNCRHDGSCGAVGTGDVPDSPFRCTSSGLEMIATPTPTAILIPIEAPERAEMIEPSGFTRSCPPSNVARTLPRLAPPFVPSWESQFGQRSLRLPWLLSQ